MALIAEPETESQLKNILRDKFKAFDDPVGNVGQNYCAVLFNPKGAAESITKPHIRVAPLRPDRVPLVIVSKQEMAEYLELPTPKPIRGKFTERDTKQTYKIILHQMWLTKQIVLDIKS